MKKCGIRNTMVNGQVADQTVFEIFYVSFPASIRSILTLSLSRVSLVLWVFHGSTLGQDNSESEPSTGVTQEIHKYVSCRRDITELKLKAE